MIEKALLAVLIVIGLVTVLGSIAGHLNDLSTRVGCATSHATLCVMDGEAH